MGELLADVATYGFSTLIVAALLCGLCPVLVLRLLLLLYPEGHERRAEWLLELRHVPYRERLMWVASLIPTAFFEAIPERVRRGVVRPPLQPPGEDVSLEGALAETGHPFDGYVRVVYDKSVDKFLPVREVRANTYLVDETSQTGQPTYVIGEVKWHREVWLADGTRRDVWPDNREI